ncbi:MAG: hypothetical protein NTU73_07295, partial [Ignavibacteriae bacterium]|nr:hypothetical protein [Ignavibacteriota bacterium]
MLGRAAGEVAQGVDILKKYGHEECETDPPIIKDAKKDAKIGIESGLSKLDLIIRNHHAFSEIRNISGDPVKELKHQKVVDIIKLLRKYDYHYDNDLKTDEKYVKFDDGNVHDCKVLGREQILDLIFINLFDNAVKFSFRGTY